MRWVRHIAFILGVGLLPFWIAVAYVIVGSIGASPGYWASAPWIVFGAALVTPYSAVVVLGTYLVYAFTRGDRSRKVRNAKFGSAIFSLLILSWIGVLIFQRYLISRREDHEVAAAAAWLIQQPQVRRHFDDPIEAESSGIARHDYDVTSIHFRIDYIEGWRQERYRYATVKLVRTERVVTFLLVCDGDLWTSNPGHDVCEEPKKRELRRRSPARPADSDQD